MKVIVACCVRFRFCAFTANWFLIQKKIVGKFALSSLLNLHHLPAAKFSSLQTIPSHKEWTIDFGITVTKKLEKEKFNFHMSTEKLSMCCQMFFFEDYQSRFGMLLTQQKTHPSQPFIIRNPWMMSLNNSPHIFTLNTQTRIFFRMQNLLDCFLIEFTHKFTSKW